MKVAYINNRDSVTGIGRYAFTLYAHIKELVNIDHLFLDAKSRTLKLISNREKEEGTYKLDYNFLFDNVACRSLLKRVGMDRYATDIRLSDFIDESYDIYHYTNQIISNSLFKNSSRGKKIITVHDLFQDNLFEYIPKKVCFSGVNLADSIICISEYSKQQVVDSGLNIHPDDIKVIYQGVDPLFRPCSKVECNNIQTKYKIPKDCINLLHVGKPFKRKNDIQLAKILNDIISYHECDNVRLIKVGLFSQDASAYIKKYHLSNNIINIQSVSETDLVGLYNSADIFVFPSISEGFGFPVLEAMACGTPVVASNTASIPEIVDNSGILISPYDTDGFSDNIIKLSSNENLQNHYSTAGLQRATQFSWDKTANMTYDLYQEVSETW